MEGILAVAGGEPSGLTEQPMEPLESRMLHPNGRALHRTRKKIDGGSDAEDDCTVELGSMGVGPKFLLWCA